MENATNSIEMQIDNFLEHFKISSQCSSDWGDTPGSSFNNLIKSRSRSSCLDVADLSENDLERALSNSTDPPKPPYEFQQQNIFNGSSILKTVFQQNVTNTSCVQNPNQYSSSADNFAKISYVNDALHIGDVADLLHFQHAIITGGKSRDGCPLIIFPDNNNFQYLEDVEYQKLLTYLTSVPSMQDADLGFQIIVDRRKDKWTAVKAVLLKISMFFPDLVHVVYVLRPSGFFQKAISEVSSKFFKEDFRFRLVICSTLEDLHEHLEKSQLTPDMGGTLNYSHHEWIQQRIALEQFSRLTQKVSDDLDIFLQNINETEFPNSVDATQKLINDKADEYRRLKEEIAAAAKHGEGLLNNMKVFEEIREFSERSGNVSALERAGKINHMQHYDDCRDYRRLLVQLEETERRFDEFFATHQNRLKLCLDLRKFEQNFRELQTCLDAHVKTVSEMTEIGDSVMRVEILIEETKTFQKLCEESILRANEILEAGQQLIAIQGAFQKDVIAPKCDELIRMCSIITERLTKRFEVLFKNRELMESVEKANKWCQRGIELLASQHMEKCSVSADLAEQYLKQIQKFISSSDDFQSSSPIEFKNLFFESTTQETKALVSQVMERINDVQMMCDKRITSLKKLALKPPRPVQTVTPEPAVPLQPPGLPPHLRRRSHPKESSTSNKLGNYRPQSLINTHLNLTKTTSGSKYENTIQEHSCNKKILHRQNSHHHFIEHHQNQHKYRQQQQQHHQHKCLREHDCCSNHHNMEKLKINRCKSNPNNTNSNHIIYCEQHSPIAVISKNDVICNKNKRANCISTKKFHNDEICKNKYNSEKIQESYLKQSTTTTTSVPINKMPLSKMKSENSIEPKLKCEQKTVNNKCKINPEIESASSPHKQNSHENYKNSEIKSFIKDNNNSNNNNNNITEKFHKNRELIEIIGNNCDKKYDKTELIDKCNDKKLPSSQIDCVKSSGVSITFLNNSSKTSSISSNCNGNNLNDVQNFNDKNLVKITTDKLLIMNSCLNNTVSKNNRQKSNLDINLKNDENRKFNDLRDENSIEKQSYDNHHHNNHQLENYKYDKRNELINQDEFKSSQHCLKIFVRNSSFCNKSISSDTNSASTTTSDDSERDFGNYDDDDVDDYEQTVIVTPPTTQNFLKRNFYALKSKKRHSQNLGLNDYNDKVAFNNVNINSIIQNNNVPLTKLGCDGGIFWNNCFYSLESNNNSINNNNNSNINQMNIHDYYTNLELMSDYQYYEIMKKTNLHELRPRSVDGGADSGVSLSSDGGCTDHDFGEQNKQDLESRRLKRGHVLHELLETERIYVTEMNSILKGYRDQMESEEMVHLVPPGLQGKEDLLFGNLDQLFNFHSETFLKDLENCISTTELVALCFVQRRDTFYRLYSFYCQNIPRSERLRETLVDTHLFLHECQKKLGHKLPLGAYLLKPVQRITKYQLLLKDLLRFSDSGTCTKELQKALDCMLIVLKCVNDSMHQIAITGYPNDLSQQGELLLQDSFQVWTENKKDLRLRLKPQQRHIFLYQKAMLFCKQAAKPTTAGHNKSTYQYKNDLKMIKIGLTESVRGDTKRFEVWLQGRQEVYTLQAPNLDIKNKWVAEIKRVLLNQLQELKGEKIKQYGLNPCTVRQSNPWDAPITVLAAPLRSLSCETSGSESNRNSNYSDDLQPGISSSSSEQQDPCGWSSDYSNSEDELSNIDDNSTPGSKYIALADYCAIGHSEVSMREGDSVELLKVGCAGWWFIKVIGTGAEGWTPAAYLEPIHRKSSRCSSRVD